MKKIERKDIMVYSRMSPIGTMAIDPVFKSTTKGMVTSEDVNKLFEYIEYLEGKYGVGDVSQGECPHLLTDCFFWADQSGEHKTCNSCGKVFY